MCESQLTRRLAASDETRQREETTVKQQQHMSSSNIKHSSRQFPSFILFASFILMLNLCPPFQLDSVPSASRSTTTYDNADTRQYLSYLESSLQFVRLVFRNPMRFEARNVATRYTLAEARVLGKMAKVWYIKKKIKKLSKKLKKHTIAVPVFTAIPIYEHSYYPQPHVTHVTHGGGMHHAAAASSYAPSVAQVSAGVASPLATASSNQQQMVTSASHNHPAAYRMAPPGGHHGHHYPSPMYQPHGGASSPHHIINAYTPSQPLYVDDAGGLYGHYGNAYGRYDAGYQMWQ